MSATDSPITDPVERRVKIETLRAEIAHYGTQRQQVEAEIANLKNRAHYLLQEQEKLNREYEILMQHRGA